MVVSIIFAERFRWIVMGNFPGRTTVEEPVTPTIMAPAVPIVRGDRIFYGWIVVAATFAVLFIAYGIQFSFGVFMHYISVDTGWDRGSLSLPYSLYVFVYSALGFASGRLDRSLRTATRAHHRWMACSVAE
jgi:hypothetical protein